MLQPVLQAHRHWHTGAQVQSEALQPVVQEYDTMIYNYIIYRHMLQPAVHARGLVRKQEEERRLPPLPSRPSTPTTWLLFTHLPGPSAHVPCLPSWQHARTPSGPLPLSPAPALQAWTEEEERVLIRSHMELGNKWSDIARRLPGRSENTVKNHWNTALRRKHPAR